MRKSKRPGGRLLRKVRLRKKWLTYCEEEGMRYFKSKMLKAIEFPNSYANCIQKVFRKKK